MSVHRQDGTQDGNRIKNSETRRWAWGRTEASKRRLSYESIRGTAHGLEVPNLARAGGPDLLE